MTYTIRCVSSHPEDLADGRVIEPGGRAENVHITSPVNARLLREQRIIVDGLAADDVEQILTDFELAGTDTELAGDAPLTGTVEEVLAQVGDDPVKARTALDLEQAASRPRSTLVDRLEAIVNNGNEEDSA